ncbi:MAG TPA: DNA-binding protein [Bacteroidetes bacterium]|nr:DNA-binding protein [Bacteroidota bacterium]
MSLPVESHRFREVRKDLRYTQAEFAQMLDLGQSTADIERGKTKISGKAVMLLQKLYGINPLWLFGESLEKYRAQTSVMPKTLVLDREGQENIMLVSAKAAAGYPLNLGDQQWFDQQPLFNMPLPMFRGGSYRGFEIEGDSMEPGFHAGDWVFGRAIDSLMDVQNQSVYVVVLHDSVLIKRVIKEVNGQRISLHSDNRRYPPFMVSTADVQELWKVVTKLEGEDTSLFSRPVSGNIGATNTDKENADIQSIEHRLRELEARMKRT